MGYEGPGTPAGHYIYPLMAMARTVQRYSKYPLVVITNTTHFMSGESVKEAFCRLGAQVWPVREVPLSERLKKTFIAPNFVGAWNKMQIWTLTEFKKNHLDGWRRPSYTKC